MNENFCITRRNFLRVTGITGIAVGLNLHRCLTGVARPGNASVEVQFAPGAKIIAGLDIGTSKTCVVVAERRRDDAIKLLGVGQATSRGVRKGEVVDLEAATETVREALDDAQNKAGFTIHSVYVGITGGHVASFNNRGVVELPEDRYEIDEDNLEEVKRNARDVNIPAQNAFLHAILQHYYVDGQQCVLSPVGTLGNELEADYHIVHCSRPRAQNTIRCVKNSSLEIEDLVFNPLAAAQALLTEAQKRLGALVIDMGSGVTDYIVYVNGVVKQSGVIAVGGDDITQDISHCLDIPMAMAETLKVEEGSVILGNCLPGDVIIVNDDSDLLGKEIKREILNTIIHSRVRVTLDLVKRTLQKECHLDSLGAEVFLTGGCSLLKGIDYLTGEIFGMPVHMTHAQTMSKPISAFENPQFSAAIGLVKYDFMKSNTKNRM